MWRMKSNFGLDGKANLLLCIRPQCLPMVQGATQGLEKNCCQAAQTEAVRVPSFKATGKVVRSDVGRWHESFTEESFAYDEEYEQEAEGEVFPPPRSPRNLADVS